MKDTSNTWKWLFTFVGVLLVLLAGFSIERWRADLISRDIKSDITSGIGNKSASSDESSLAVENAEIITYRDKLNGTQYPKRAQLVLPADIAREFGRSLDSMKMMSVALYERYPDDIADYYDYNRVDIEDGNNVFFFTSNNGQELRVEEVIASDGVQSYIVDKVKYYVQTETRSIPFEAKSIYEYTPDMKSKFTDYVISDGFNNAELVAVEELECCYYIYFTTKEESRFIRVSKESEEITVRGTTVNSNSDEPEVKDESN